MTDNDFYSILTRCMPSYTPIEKIGTGSFGSVFKCERDGIYYAIKIIAIPSTDNELDQLLSRYELDAVKESLRDKVDNYRKEIKLMSELKGNRSIVNIEDYQVVESDDGLRFYIVIRMELLTSLTSYSSKNTLSQNDIIRMGIDICDALIICEKHSVVHRDIKPENIMIHSDGAFKLGDFGVAKQLSKTTVGTIAGTEGFMAPEISKGQEYSHTADIYSLGILLYYYLNSKKMPFVAPDNRSIIAEQEAIMKRMNYTEVLPLPANCSESLGRIVVKACMFDKSCRYRSAADMRADLVKVLNGEAVTVDLAPSSERGTIAQINENRQNIHTNDFRFEGDVVDGTAEKRRKSRDKTTEAFDKPNTPKKKKKGLIAIVVAVCVVAIGIGGFTVYQKLFAGPEPGIYLDENGNEYEVLSKEAMEEAYNLGVQYAEQGEYQEAIDEFNKVSEYSGKYDEAQKAIEKAKADYQIALIDKATEYTANKDYEKAFSMIDTGVAALGDNAKFKEAKDAVLAALKVDYVARAEEHEKSENYDKALECIKLVLTYLPDDYEVKGMQSRVNAANVAKKALEKAAEYKYKSEYAKLFSSLDKALDDVTDSTSATATIKMAYDSYMDEYLELIETQTSDLETVSEYETAIKLLESAVEIFPNDYDLKTQLQEARDMKVAIKAISDADNYANKNDYVNLFKTLNKAIDTLSMGSDAGKKVQSAYDKYEEKYLNTLSEQIGEPQTVAEYDNAISLLETAISILSDNYELTERLNTLIDIKPVDLFSLQMISAKSKHYDSSLDWNDLANNNAIKINTKATDGFGNQYNNATLLWNSSTTMLEVTYDIWDYSSLTGTISLYNPSKSGIVIVGCEFAGKTKSGSWETFYSKFIDSTTRPITVSFDISAYETLAIYMYTTDGVKYRKAYDCDTGVILHNFTLTK